jgi:phospholipid/cholesterol/gamma-HCH transport system permease protein
MRSSDSSKIVKPAAGRLRSQRETDGTLILFLEGRLDAVTTAEFWREAFHLLAKEHPAQLKIDGRGIEYCDGSGSAFLLELLRQGKQLSREPKLEGLRPEVAAYLAQFDPSEFDSRGKKTPEIGWIESGPPQFPGLGVPQGVDPISLERRLPLCFGRGFIPGKFDGKTPHQARNARVWMLCPLYALVSFLMGLILAFQSSIPLKQFGAAEIFIGTLVSLSMIRELGPLMTAILLAGRTGSAFAAELGTMKINEEIDALTTMGLDPVRFLAITRILAAVAMTPLLALFADFMGVIGGAVVFRSFGYSLVAYWNQVQASVDMSDLLGGLFKSFVFGILVASVGCLRGFQTKTGASAVGSSTTRAVVSGIILIVAADGVFSIIYYVLGI